ncbi:MAG: hypothetical protein QCH31_03500 [Methanolobus sp.]|nr:hypothetical protein [Methanolobus sp.]
MDVIDAFLIGIALFIVFILLTSYFLKSFINMSSNVSMKESHGPEKESCTDHVQDEKKD